MTVSCGVVAGDTSKDMELEMLLRAADKALCHTEGEGCNCVKVATEEDFDEAKIAPEV